MATLLHSESRRLYSWWWDSHISPKNSKWLQENLTDMDAKVKAMIKLIEEDADSFARRAEMYYKKRPELMKLVEEFYRAYRALAERYDHATGELRQAHRTMAEAFPNQLPFVLADDSPSGSAQGTEPHTPEMPHPVRALFGPDDLHKDALGLSASDLHYVKKNGSYSGDSDAVINKKGLKQLYEMFGSGEVVPHNINLAEGKVRKGLNHDMEEKEESLHGEIFQLSNENENLKTKVLSECERAGKAESEVQNLKKALIDMQAEKEAVLSQYQQSLEKLSSLEGELICAEKDSSRLKEQASKAESEFCTLKEAIIKLEAERDAGFIKNKDCLQRIYNLEVMVSRAQEDAKGLDERTIKAEMEAQYLKNELFRSESEKEAGLLQYKQCLEKISDLERKVFVAEEDARRLTQQAERAESEVEKLKITLAEVTAQKEAVTLQYNLCLEKISKLESKISCAQEDIRRLNSEILMGATKLRTAEGKCDLLEMSNQTLRLEAENLVKKISLKDTELSEKHGELEKLQVCVQDERSRYDQIEATLHTLQNMYSQSQEEQRTLSLEFKNGLQMLKDMEICKHGLEQEIRQIKDENRSLNEINSSSTMSMRDLQNEILGLTRMKARLEEEVALQLSQSNALQQEICCLKEEIDGLNRSYQALIKQMELVGLNPKCFGTSVKELQDENSRLRQIYEKDRDEKETLSKKLVNMEELVEKNAALQSSLSDVNGELEGSQEKVKVLQESCNSLHGEKSALAAEKAVLLSQLQIITENLQKLLEKNTVLENSLCSANSELEGLRGKSKSLEELCQLLGNEKANLLTERSALARQLEIVELKLENLEMRFIEFEEKYAGLEKEKDSTHSQLEELRVSFRVEKQERASLTQWSESQLASLENHIHLLQEESRWRKKEFQEELDKAVISQFEIFILQKFVEDMEEKNYSLLTKCQKQMEASRLAEELISELENENLEQQVEAEILFVEIENLRLGIYRVFKALEISPDSGSEEKTENEQIFVHRILEDIANMKHSLSKYTDDKHQLVVENSVLLTLLGQLRLEGLEVESEKNNLDQAFKSMTEQLLMVQREKHELLDMNRQLRSEVSNHHADMLMAEVESLSAKQAGMQSAYLELQEEYSQTLEENRTLLKNFSDLKEEKSIVEEENNAILLEMLTFGNLSTIFKSFRSENAAELRLLSEDLHQLHGVNNELEKEVSTLKENLGTNETENLYMKNLVEKLEMELSEVKDLNYRLKQEISSGMNFLSQREKELSDAKQKLVKTENLNSELCRTVEGLKRESEKSEFVRENLELQIFKLSEDNMNQNEEIQCLLEVKGKLETELGKLNEESEERRIREENLNSELQERLYKFELWDAEASSFYFDLQLSSILEVLFEDKVHELTGVCESLQDESASKTQEIELMKERFSFNENESGGLKSQLLAYAPAIDSLRDNIESLEHSTLSRAKLVIADYQTPKEMGVEVFAHEKICQEPVEDQNSTIPDGILDLQKLQKRIKAVENVLLEEMNRIESKESSSTNIIKLKAAMREIESLKSKCRPVQEKDKQTEEEGELWIEPSGNLKLQKTKPKHPEVKNGILMKDIPLDQVSDCSLYGRSRRGNSQVDEQMLVLWETDDNDRSSVGQNLIELQKQDYEATEDDIVYNQFEDADQSSNNPSSELEMEKELGVDKLQVSTSASLSNRGGNKKKILERLASDGQKLANIQTTVHDLRRKLETNKKSRNAKNVDLETVKEQLQEVEETAVQLFDLNVQMTRKIEEIPFSSDGKDSTELDEAVSVQKKRVSEQARKGSEKIGRLQLEIQKIQYVLLKLEDDKKSKGKNRFSRTKSRTTIILRDFIHSGKRSSVRQKKGPLCGCFKPLSSGEANI